MNLKIGVIFLFFWTLSQTIKAQNKQVSNQSLLWLRYYNQCSINNKWTLHNEIENRWFFENKKQQLFIAHSRIHYQLKSNLNIATGLTYARQSPQDPNSKISMVIPELRFVQEINLNTEFSEHFSVQHRLRVDERFIHKNFQNELSKGYDFNFRFRYRLQVSYVIKNNTNTILKLSNELMVNSGKKIIYNRFDQNRLYLGVEKKINKSFSTEIGYLHLYQQRPSGFQFFEREIIRLTVHHQMKIINKKQEELF